MYRRTYMVKMVRLGSLACCSPWIQRVGKDWATEQQQKGYIYHSIIKCPTWLFSNSIWYKAVKFWVKQQRSRARQVRPTAGIWQKQYHRTASMVCLCHGLGGQIGTGKTPSTEMTGATFVWKQAVCFRLWKHNLFVNLSSYILHC